MEGDISTQDQFYDIDKLLTRDSSFAPEIFCPDPTVSTCI